MLEAEGEGLRGTTSTWSPGRSVAFGRRAAQAAVRDVRAVAADIEAFARRAPIRSLAYLLAGFSFAAMSLPGIDLTVTGWFAAPGGGFPLAADEKLVFIRDLNRLIPKLLLPGLAAVLVLHALRPKTSWLVRPHQALFVIGAYAIGGGAVVHLLKNVLGRARPDTIAEFGGRETFSVAWQLSGACLSNCSFPSGEGASAMALLACAMLVPRTLRRAFLWVLVPVAVVFSINRIAFGRHFLSDIVISWLLVGMVMIALWRCIRRRAEEIDRAFTAAGLPLVAAGEKAIASRRRKKPAEV